MESVLEEADLVICHAGSGVVSESLLAGVPLLMMPTNVEQHLQGSRVRETGAGVLIGEARTKSDLSTAVRELLSNSRYRSNAQSFAALHREFDPAAVISKAANAVRRIIDRGVLH
jgi:UDP:flavonoid glycosyltransferase YjiC (YdhE family)